MSKNFSVIIPSYNRASIIRQTLDSILQQTHRPAEIIVVDDGSTDNTAEVVSSYGSQLRLIRISNSGPAGARHTGVLASSSEFLAFCDSDDIWLPDHLSRLAQLLDRETVQFAFANFFHIKNNAWEGIDKFSEAPAGTWQCIKNPNNPEFVIVEPPLYPFVLEFQPVFPSCSGVSRRLYDRVGGYRKEFGFIPSEDLEFTLRCLCKGSAGIVLKPTVGIRKHEGNRSANFGDNHLSNVTRQMIGETRILEYSRDNHPIDPAWVKPITRQIIRRSLMGFDAAFAGGELPLAKKFARKIPASARSFKFYIKFAILLLPRKLAAQLSNSLAGSHG